jgi:hypothetical protein
MLWLRQQREGALTNVELKDCNATFCEKLAEDTIKVS